ncbi:dmsr-1 [Pristionchus pacificus]|uniref:Dmsr-1 n=1 Tax=Pristionchus pacificus TaxID=54126 RepID=A0A2A6C5V9_PRIPA|nr:dmsr-1 [Pristionchus pacificus]|eukprot:PDM73401.1 dmsr-1 [Pristionchus pacificus]
MDSDACRTVILQLPNESSVYVFLKQVQAAYHPIHTYLSIILCLVGAATNFCNIVVLTRRQMRTPVNTILTAMACCDTVVLFSNLIYTTHYSFVAFQNCRPQNWSYGWALFLIAHAHLSLVGHSSSVWLSVMLGLIRYLTLRARGNAGSIQITLKHSHAAIAAVVCFVSIVNVPNFLTYKIDERMLHEMCTPEDNTPKDAVAFLPGIAEMATANGCIVFRAAFWISGLIFKVIPCIVLTVLVWLLLRILKEVKANHARLLKSSQHGRQVNGTIKPAPQTRTTSTVGQSNLQRGPSLRHHSRAIGRFVRNSSFSGDWSTFVDFSSDGRATATTRGERTDRTTHMLLAIVAVLLITELPQGVMAVLSGLFSEEFRIHVYNSLGDLLDLLSLCGACTSFIIYCIMSGQFRHEFCRIFVPDRWKHYLCAASRGRRASETYTKMTLIRPSELNHSVDDRSIAITVVGSAATMRKDKDSSGSPAERDGTRTPLTPMTPISPPLKDDRDEESRKLLGPPASMKPARNGTSNNN